MRATSMPKERDVLPEGQYDCEFEGGATYSIYVSPIHTPWPDRQDYQAGKVGKETRSRSGKNLAVGRPRKAVNGERLAELRAQGMGWRQIAARLSIGATTARRAFEGLSARHKPITEFWHGFQIRPTTLTASRVQQSIRGSATSSFGIRSSFDSKEHLRPWRHFLNIDDHSESVFCEKARLNALPSKLAFSPDSPH